jgi:glyoxylase-like metal-dependent hydrolase (beta-lactamase superfamily II)
MLNVIQYGKVKRIEMAQSLLGRGWYWTCAYLIGETLIDSGPAHTSDALMQLLEGLQLRQILNSHAHEDHIGANGPLQKQRNNLKIYAHPDAIPILEDPAGKQPLQLYRRIMWGWPEASAADPIDEGDVVTDGALRWQVLHTPGHTEHHLCFYEPERGWLFSGDLFVGGRDRALGAGNDIWQILASLKRLSNLPARMLFPASARVRTDPQAALRGRVRMLEDLAGQILTLHGKGWGVGRIAREVSGGPMPIELFTGGHFSRRHLIRSFLRRPESKIELQG